MPPIYLDTSALVRRAEAGASSPDARNLKAGPPVAMLLSGTNAVSATSEVGLLEFHDVVTKLWREGKYDGLWCDSAIGQVMDDIADHRLAILPVAPKAFEEAMKLVTLATRQHGKKFRVWDAVHLITAVHWSGELQEPVELWTTDTDFEGFVDLYRHFRARVAIVNLDD